MTSSRLRFSLDPEELDQVRGVLFGLANGGEEFFDSVSTLAIRSALARRAREVAPAALLDELAAIRDVQRLQGGYWVPSETIIVPVSSVGIVTSGLPTSLLRSKIGVSLFGTGAARLVRLADVGPPPNATGSFSWWCNAPSDTVGWAGDLLKCARFGASFDTVDLEVFNHWDRAVDRRWARRLPSGPQSGDFALARQSGPIGTLYFVLRFKARGEFEVAELGNEWSTAMRMGLALRAREGNAPTYTSRLIAPGVMHVTVPRYLPQEENIALRALGVLTAGPNTSLMVAEVPVDAWPQVESMLHGLGLKEW